MHELGGIVPGQSLFDIRHNAEIIANIHVPIRTQPYHIRVMVIINITFGKGPAPLLIHDGLAAVFAVATQLRGRRKLRGSVDQWRLAHSES